MISLIFFTYRQAHTQNQIKSIPLVKNQFYFPKFDYKYSL